MKPVFQKLTESPEEGFAFKVIRGTTFDCPGHFHNEHELILVLLSRGYRMVGDNITPLEPGDLVLVGPNPPQSLFRGVYCGGSEDNRGRCRRSIPPQETSKHSLRREVARSIIKVSKNVAKSVADWKAPSFNAHQKGAETPWQNNP